MRYRFLTDAHHDQIRQQKMLDLEAAHARLSLDLDLAQAAGVATEVVAPLVADLAVVTAQIDALARRMDGGLPNRNGTRENTNA
jgi:hypothetical protein